MGPCLGKALAKAGYLIRPVPNHLDWPQYLRGDATSRLVDCSHVPFLADVWHRVEALLGRGRLKFTKQDAHDYYYHLHATGRRAAFAAPTYCNAAVNMVAQLYGLDFEALQQYRCDLASVSSLPACVELPGLAAACVVDGVSDCSFIEATGSFAPLLRPPREYPERLQLFLCDYDPLCLVCHSFPCPCLPYLPSRATPAPLCELVSSERPADRYYDLPIAALG
jgi:hypothetical protein